MDIGLFLEVLSRIVSLVLAILALSGFMFRRWISAWIEDRFKRRIETALLKLKHEYTLEVEQKKAELTKEVEKYRREVDDHVRRSSRIYDKKFEAYELFDSEYGRVIAELYALQSMNAEGSQIGPEIWNAYRPA